MGAKIKPALAGTGRSQTLTSNELQSKTAKDLLTSENKASAFDPTTHKPPRVDQFGYNKETHKGRELLNRNAKNALCNETKIPTWWLGKRIRDKNFGAGS